MERLRQAGDQPVAFAELHAGGIDFPATVVSELQLNGYATCAETPLEALTILARFVEVARSSP